MRFEATVEDCVTTYGEIPKELTGGFYRVGPTFKRPTKQGANGLLAMDGMIQGLTLENGRPTFVTVGSAPPNTYSKIAIRAACSAGPTGTGMTGATSASVRPCPVKPPGAFLRAPTTSIAFRSPAKFWRQVSRVVRQLLWIRLPWKRAASCRGLLSCPAGFSIRPGTASAFTAHPKWDSASGTLYGWSYSNRRPYVTVNVVEPGGSVLSRELWDAPYTSEVHDMWLTPDWLVLPFQGFAFDPDRVHQGLSVQHWQPDLPIMLAMVPRDDIENGDIRWVTADIEPQYVMHTLAANVSGNTMTLDAPVFERPPFPLDIDGFQGEDVSLFFNLARSTLGRWTVDLDSGAVKSEPLDDRPCELPKVDERFYGRGHRWGYLIGGDARGNGMRMHSLVVRDIESGSEQEYRLRHDRPALVMEPTFVPRTPDAEEGEGYVIVPVSRWAENLGEFVIFDTHDITAGPVCRIEIPFLLGFTPHGHWMDFR